MSIRFSRLKLCRLAAGLLQLELAKRARIPCLRLAEIENGLAVPHPDELDRISTALGIPIHLLTSEGTPRPVRKLRLLPAR